MQLALSKVKLIKHCVKIINCVCIYDIQTYRVKFVNLTIKSYNHDQFPMKHYCFAIEIRALISKELKMGA